MPVTVLFILEAQEVHNSGKIHRTRPDQTRLYQDTSLLESLYQRLRTQR